MKPTCVVALLMGFLIPASLSAADVDAVLNVSGETLNQLVGEIGDLSDYDTSELGVISLIPGVGIEIGDSDCPFLGFINCPGLNIPELAMFDRLSIRACIVPPQTLGSEDTYKLVPVGAWVNWQWWLDDPQFVITDTELRFEATYTAVVDSVTDGPRTVSAAATPYFHGPTNRMMIVISPLNVSPNYVTDEEEWMMDPPVLNLSQMFQISVEVEPQTFSIPLPNGTTKTVTAHIVELVGDPEYDEDNDKLRIKVDVAF